MPSNFHQLGSAANNSINIDPVEDVTGRMWVFSIEFRIRALRTLQRAFHVLNQINYRAVLGRLPIRLGWRGTDPLQFLDAPRHTPSSPTLSSLSICATTFSTYSPYVTTPRTPQLEPITLPPTPSPDLVGSWKTTVVSGTSLLLGDYSPHPLSPLDVRLSGFPISPLSTPAHLATSPTTSHMTFPPKPQESLAFTFQDDLDEERGVIAWTLSRNDSLNEISIDMSNFDAENKDHRDLLKDAWQVIPRTVDSVKVLSKWSPHAYTLDSPGNPLVTLLDRIGVDKDVHTFSYIHLKPHDTPTSQPPTIESKISRPTDAFPWTNLRSLSLDCDLPFDFYRTALAVCSEKLEKLSLKGISTPINDASGTASLRLAFPNLRHLELAFSADIKGLVAALDFSSVKSLEVTTDSATMEIVSDYRFNWLSLERLVCHGPSSTQAVTKILRQTPNLQALDLSGQYTDNQEQFTSIGLYHLKSLKHRNCTGPSPLQALFNEGQHCFDELHVPFIAVSYFENFRCRRVTFTAPITPLECLQALNSIGGLEEGTFELKPFNESNHKEFPRIFQPPLLKRLTLKYHDDLDDLRTYVNLLNVIITRI